MLFFLPLIHGVVGLLPRLDSGLGTKSLSPSQTRDMPSPCPVINEEVKHFFVDGEGLCSTHDKERDNVLFSCEYT